MFKEMRRKDRQATPEEAINCLNTCSYGVLSTIREDGFPYGVPINYVFIDGKIYFHCALENGHKLENIKYNSKVSFTVVSKDTVIPDKFSTDYESAIAFGEAIRVFDNEKKLALEAFLDKFAPNFKELGMAHINKFIDKTDIYKIEIETLTGKRRK